MGGTSIMGSHVHAKLMAEYAKDALETEKPWGRWQFNSSGVWCGCESHPSWSNFYEYRRKPKTSRERFEDWWNGPSGYSDTFDPKHNQALDAWQEAERQARELDK